MTDDSHIATRTRDAINRDITALQGVDLPVLGRRLHAAITDALTHPSGADGMPRQTIGASTTSHLAPAPELDDDGNPLDPIHWTSVEAAGNQRATTRADEHQRLVHRARTQLTTATRELLAAQHTLDQLDQLRTNTDGVSTEEGCYLMNTVGVWEQPTYRIDIPGIGRRGVSEWVYRFATKVGRLPNAAEIQQRANGRRVMVKAS